MTRYSLLFAFAVLPGVGCIPVTVPVGDIDKTPPADKLVGTWNESDSLTWVVDRPEVKGNPKGLMRLRCYDSPEAFKKGAPRDTIWFFAATVGKVTYANALIKDFAYADLSKEGAYAAWKKDPRYWLALLSVEADEVRVYVPSSKAFESLMEENKVTADKFSYYTLPPGKLEKILGKGIGADALTDSPTKLTRVKAK